MPPLRNPINAGYRHPSAAISYVVWLYFRFPLSLRMVEEMKTARRVSIIYQTIRQRGRKFGRAFANRIRQRAPCRGDTWHLDEVMLTITGKKHHMRAEWLERDDLGGFASGTIGGEQTRRYHALLLAAATPPTDLVVLVNGIEVWLEGAEGPILLSTQRYTPDVQFPEGWRGITAFSTKLWPTWHFQRGLTQEMLVGRHGEGTVLR